MLAQDWVWFSSGQVCPLAGILNTVLLLHLSSLSLQPCRNTNKHTKHLHNPLTLCTAAIHFSCTVYFCSVSDLSYFKPASQSLTAGHSLHWFHSDVTHWPGQERWQAWTVTGRSSWSHRESSTPLVFSASFFTHLPIPACEEIQNTNIIYSPRTQLPMHFHLNTIMLALYGHLFSSLIFIEHLKTT